jgi:hypothetical protein
MKSKIVLFTCSILISFTILELVSKFIFENQPNYLKHIFENQTQKPTWGMLDKKLGWVNKAGDEFIANEGQGKKITNWDNFRRASYIHKNFDKVNNKRIIFFGDSWTSGFGVNDEDSFPWLLNNKKNGYYFENFGTPGYSTFQSYLLADRIFSQSAIHPDTVFLGFTPFMSTRDSKMWPSTFSGSGSNINVIRPPFLLRDKSGKIKVSSPWITDMWKLEKNSYFIKMLHSVFVEIYKRINQNTIFENKNPKHNKTTMIVTFEILKLFEKRVKENNSKFVIVVLTAGKASNWKWLFNKVKDNDIDLIDCSLNSNVEKKYLNDPGGHPNEKYNIYYSNCINNYIVKNK